MQARLRKGRAMTDKIAKVRVMRHDLRIWDENGNLYSGGIYDVVYAEIADTGCFVAVKWNEVEP